MAFDMIIEILTLITSFLIIVYHIFRPHFNLLLFQEQEEVDFNFPQMVRLYLNYILDFFNYRLAHTRAVYKLHTVRKTRFKLCKDIFENTFEK